MINYEICPDQELVVVSITGALDQESALASIVELRADSRYKSSFKGVCDFRSANTVFTLTELQLIVAVIEELPGKSLSMWALLVTAPRLTALANLYAELGKHLHQVKEFSTVKAAGDWLDRNLSAFLPVD